MKTLIYAVEPRLYQQESLRELLLKSCPQVRMLSSFAAFLADYSNVASACLVIHLGMPPAELFQQLAERQLKLPVIPFAERPSVRVVVESMKRGALGFLELPLQAPALTKLVQQGLKQDRKRVSEEGDLRRFDAVLNTLSVADQAVVSALQEGLSMKQIATHLNVSYRTVQKRRATLFRKTATKNQTDLLHWMISAYNSRLIAQRRRHLLEAFQSQHNTE